MSKRNFVIAAVALVASATFALPASAAGAPEAPLRGAVTFWLLDRNNDGAIDKAEIEALRATIFDAVDTNGDGKVTKDEFMAAIEQMHDFRGGPGGPGGPGGDGPRHGYWGGHDGPGGRHGYWEEHGDRRDGPPKRDFAERRGDRMMERLGIDTTDGLSKSEFVDRSPQLFERADQNGDGSVSKSEFDQAAARIGRLFMME